MTCKYYKQPFYLLSFFLCLAKVSSGQSDSLTTEEIFVVKEFNPVVSSVGPKISTEPTVVKGNVEKKEISHQFIRKEHAVDYEPSPIAPAKMKKESLHKLYKSYARLGIGNYLSTVADFYHSTTRSSKKMLGIQLNHQGASSKIKGAGFAGYSENSLGAFAHKYYRKKIFSGHIDYNYNRYHYYGYDPIFFPDLNKENTKIFYSRYGLNLRLRDYPVSNEVLESPISDIQLSYRFQNDHFKSQEHNPVLKYTYSTPINTDRLDVNTFLDYNTLRAIDSSFNSNIIFALKPVFVTQKDNFNLRLGAAIFMDATSSAKFSFKPLLYAKYNLIKDIVMPYAGLEGRIMRNNFMSLSSENPYLNSSFLNVQNTDQKIHAYGGIKSSLSKDMTLDLNAHYQKLNNLPLFINDTFGIVNNQFLILYDDVSQTSFNAQLSYNRFNNLEINVSGSYYLYSLLNESEAWHLPNLYISGDVKYNIQDKLILGSTVFYNGKRFAKIYGFENGQTTSSQVKELKPYIDLNLSAEYRYSHKISAFVYLNNLTGGRYQKWYNYPVYPINIVGGVTFLF